MGPPLPVLRIRWYLNIASGHVLATLGLGEGVALFFGSGGYYESFFCRVD
jgi:hypothetical protein